jgi:copper chaperone
MEIRIEVENIRCGGCANTITKKLQEDQRITSVNIDIENQTVILESDEDIKADATKILLGLGYPEKGSVEGLQALKGKAKSVVSCAIGKVS